MTFRGDDATDATPKFDFLFRRANGRAVTVGIGDGGNELGFGSIRAAVKTAIGASATGDPDRIALVTEVDYILPAAGSNWGATRFWRHLPLS